MASCFLRSSDQHRKNSGPRRIHITTPRLCTSPDFLSPTPTTLVLASCSVQRFGLRCCDFFHSNLPHPGLRVRLQHCLSHTMAVMDALASPTIPRLVRNVVVSMLSLPWQLPGGAVATPRKVGTLDPQEANLHLRVQKARSGQHINSSPSPWTEGLKA